VDPSEINTLNVTGSGATALFKTSGTEIGTLTITSGGAVTSQARDQTPTTTTARPLIVSSLNLGTPSSPSGTLDLKDNVLILDYSGSTPYPSVKSLMTAGYNNRAWNGNGIMSSLVAGGPPAGEAGRKAVGYGEATTLGYTTFAGRTLDSTVVLVKYTYEADANLDGKVDVGDLGILASNWQAAGDWQNGDFDFSGTVEVNDLGFLGTNWQQGVTTPLLMGGDPEEEFLEGIEKLGLSEDEIAKLLEGLGSGGGEEL
jgi:hypothetical protein